jgi:hypothetical protein
VRLTPTFHNRRRNPTILWRLIAEETVMVRLKR